MKHKAVVATSYGFRLTDECEEWLKAHGLSEDKIKDYIKGNVPRHDPLLVQCVEEIKANGPYFKKRGYPFSETDGYYENVEVEVVEFDCDRYFVFEWDEGEELITADDPRFIDLSDEE